MSAVLSFVLKLKKNDLKYKLCPYSYVGRLIFTYETYKEPASLENDIFHLLPAYDEYIIGYKNRTNVLDLEHYSKAFNNYGTFKPIILYNGHVVGNWKIIKKEKEVDLDVTFWDDKFKTDKKRLTQAEEKMRYYING